MDEPLLEPLIIEKFPPASLSDPPAARYRPEPDAPLLPTEINTSPADDILESPLFILISPDSPRLAAPVSTFKIPVWAPLTVRITTDPLLEEALEPP